MNQVTLLGRLTREIELQYLQSGTAVARGTLAVDKGLSKEKKAELENQGKPTADFINIVAWGGTAEFLANYSKKGGRVAVSGRLQSGQYQDPEGRTVYTTDVNVNQVEIIDWKQSELPIIEDYPEGDIPF